MICLAAKVAQQCPNAELVFFTPDTDVLVLAIGHYGKLCKRTSISMVLGIIDIKPIWRALGEEKLELYLCSMHSLEQTVLGNSQNKMVSAIHKS